MTDAPLLDQNAKLRVRDAAKAALLDELNALRTDIATERTAADPDPSSSYSIDDLSQSDEEGAFTENLTRSEDALIASLAGLETLNLTITDTVGPGAIIAFDGAHYLVGITEVGFDSDGVHYEGIATDAPIYETIKERKAGERFTFRGSEHDLEQVI